MQQQEWRGWSNERWVEGIREGRAEVQAAVWQYLDSRGRWLIEDDRRITENIHLQAVPLAYERVLSRVDQFRGDSAFTSWMARILTKACYELLRRSALDEQFASVGQGDLSIELIGRRRGAPLRAVDVAPLEIDDQQRLLLDGLADCVAALTEQRRRIVEDAPLPRAEGYAADSYSLMEHCRVMGQAMGLHWRKVLREYHAGIAQLRTCLSAKGFLITPELSGPSI